MAFVNGQPDIGVITPDELVQICRKIRRSISLPIVVDFEQGFGEPYVSVFWMNELERAGVAAVHIDDYGLPYKCPFIPPHVMALESMDETADKIRAMAGEKLNPDFMVIGRPGTYVARVHPDEESRRADWLRRAKAYQEAGSDAIMAICWTVEHAKFFRSQIEGPMMTIRSFRSSRRPCWAWPSTPWCRRWNWSAKPAGSAACAPSTVTSTTCWSRG
jgi:methylisocitrate lyase